MMTAKLKFLMIICLTNFLSSTVLSFGIDTSSLASTGNLQSIEIRQGEDFKYGQYVYVTLKDGSQTVGKIVGKKNSNKYYVNQIDGSNRGLVHKKYIRKMTKDEIEGYKSSRKKIG